MKIYRLLEIIIYLLNHTSATARELADRFEVSARTIQRDMDSLLIAGIPVISSVGIYGGYSIDPSYKLENQFIKKEDFSLIIMALKSLSTSYDDDKIEQVLYKYTSLAKKTELKKVYLDYGVTKENPNVLQNNKIIEDALQSSKHISFSYQNMNHYTSLKEVIPLALRFKWYAWYLFAIDIEKDSYRTYKISRMSDVQITTTSFIPYDDKTIEGLLITNDATYLQTCETIELWCYYSNINTMLEYFPDALVNKQNDGDYQVFIHVPLHEKLWQALLLGMGNQVKIISPIKYREKLITIANNFLSNYDS
ncbi:helix-turn-helix transcriptional regulator [Breznakia pachnodae]|uniref:DNA-binding transcriptional regulator YafY n=1 Tax=Breznakia pachnodae TaxID=265178 RepID=A0ABU0E8R2_9FIRM|nr:WYL domain-containing protein [Breznakia pachnodae]MDQ0363262.1 putative DNA-binding transcriptional regulator YafY [Breznakia pachnodae]